MVQMGEGFDPKSVDPNKLMEVLPPGKYQAQIVDSELKRNSKNTGSYLKFTFKVIVGEHSGRQVFANLNVDNPSKVAQDIALGDLSAICHAIGQFDAVTDTMQLHSRPMMIIVGIQADGKYNEIKGYESIAGATAAPSAPAAGTPKAPSTPAWNNPPK